MTKNSKNNASNKQQAKAAPETTETQAPNVEGPTTQETVTPPESTETQAPETTETSAPETTPAKGASKVTVSNNMPKSAGSGGVAGGASADSPYVKQLTSVTEEFIKVAKDKDHTVETFNRSKQRLANALFAAVKYEDGNEFVGSMNAFLKLVRDNRKTAFHESVVNMYVPWLDMPHLRTLELSRIFSVFQQLASSDSKTISKDVDFNTVFPTNKDERIISRFRNWAIRQA